MLIQFSVPGKPMAWQRAGHYTEKSGAVVSYTPVEMRNYQALVAMCAVSERNKQPGDWQMMSGPLKVNVECYFPISKTRMKHTKEGDPHTQRPDGDNCLKNICDSLNQILWSDDCSVYQKTVTKYWTHEPPKTLVTVESL